MIRISFGGDLLCKKEETLAVLKKNKKLDYSDYLVGLKPLIVNSDYAIANLETPVSPSNSTTDFAISFNSPVEFLDAVKDVGFDFLSTANNHCLDRGVLGLIETLQELNKRGIAHDGTFLNESDAHAVYVEEIKGVRFAIISCTFGTNSQINGLVLPEDESWRVALFKRQNKLRKLPLTADFFNGNVRTYIADETSAAAIMNSANAAYFDRILEKLHRARSIADIVIVMPHVGGQYNPGPAYYTKWVVSQFEEAGADIVIAGHPHVPHRVEWRQNCLVCYSLGNLSFTPGVGFFVPNVLAEYGIILHVDVDDKTKKVVRCSFGVVKNVVDEDGCAHVLSVTNLFEKENNHAQRDRLAMENEAVVNRVCGTGENIEIQSNYEIRRR